MIIVIIAGGSGTRLWPLSTPKYPKHLLKLEGDRSLLQSTYDRAKLCADDIYVITEAGHAHHIREQLPALPKDNLIIEPARRGTANCLLAGLLHIGRRHDKTEPIAFIHSDHAVRDTEGFKQSFHIAATATKAYQRICLVGVEPTYPSIALGYIKKSTLIAGEDMVYDVELFKEKPSFEVAQEYVKAGHYLWNTGYFVGSFTTFMATIDAFSPVMAESYKQLIQTSNDAEFKKAYLGLATDTIDYALSDRVTNFMVVPATFDWMDVGLFQDLYDVTQKDERGNVIRGGRIIASEVQNAFIRNEEDKPLAVIGLDNVIVVNTPHGIVVARKDLSQKVGDAAKAFQAEAEKKK